VEKIVSAVVQEDVDVLGLSVLSGSHLELGRELMDSLRAQGVEDVLVLMGGIIPREDIPKLKELGVDGVFPVHSTLQGIEQFIRDEVPRKKSGYSPERTGT
jgi:methylmalonyl-CoA mutase C-terminal domain/subunit